MLIGGLGDDNIIARAGNVTVRAGGGDDRVSTGSGDDTIDGASGRDVIRSGAGDDIIDVADLKSRDVVNCSKGNDTVRADRFDRLRNCEQIERVKPRRPRHSNR
jgi:Ca2+-binding RTX toxin-like protein